MSEHLDTKTLYSLFNARGALPEAAVRHLNSCEQCGRVFRYYLSLDIESLDIEQAGEVNYKNEAWEDAVFALAYGEEGIDANAAKLVAEPDTDYQRVYLRILGDSADYAQNRLAEVSAICERPAETLKAKLESFFVDIASVAAGLVVDIGKFLTAPDVSLLVPAIQFRTLAATAAQDTPAQDALNQHMAVGKLPNEGVYRLIYQPFETILEIEAFKPNPPRVLYYRTNDDQTAFEQYSAVWTSAKPNKWTMKLSPDHPAIVALPEWNYVILAQSYKSLQR
ncbi:MAG: hypothetical protein LBL96_08415 [Clostridiales bacterium]|nr:hypothetical protein [Clostridiales bacterium]